MSRSGKFGQLDILSPVTAVVFSAVCWLVFSKVFGDRDSASLPALTQHFLSVQPWWLVAGVLGFVISALARTSKPASRWNQIGLAYSLALGAFSVVNIGWGIVAMYQLILVPVNI
ncbi:MAG TPA: hypothetical protein VFN25_04470 [Dokdonella sp.]|uniref:hypothetical protein n=1 Tax=Dokdonella sp. TaxID=2291710 RepID=UPI002D7ECC30|nr:hypothetical protein [Dokdonella sp.]HET9032143.1 hypothetical protein [Dokdonella sp.]